LGRETGATGPAARYIRAPAITDPTGQPVQPGEIVVLTCREQWPRILANCGTLLMRRSAEPFSDCRIADGNRGGCTRRRSPCVHRRGSGTAPRNQPLVRVRSGGAWRHPVDAYRQTDPRSEGGASAFPRVGSPTGQRRRAWHGSFSRQDSAVTKLRDARGRGHGDPKAGSFDQSVPVLAGSQSCIRPHPGGRRGMLPRWNASGTFISVRPRRSPRYRLLGRRWFRPSVRSAFLSAQSSPPWRA